MKLKEPIYPVEPWTITEQEFKKETNYRNETTFALSNGYLGSRGTFEEGYAFTPEEGLEGNFINGFYESESIRYGEWNYGFPLTSQSLLNLPNMKTTYIFLGDEKLDLFKGKICSHQRKLHMKDGFVGRETVWQSPEGKEVKLYTERFCAMDCKNLMVMKIQITPLNFSGRIQIKSLLEGQVENHTRITNPLVDYGPFGPHLCCDELQAEGMDFYFEGTTKNSNLTMACMGRHETAPGRLVSAQAGVDKEKSEAWINLELEGKEKETIVVCKYLAYTSSLDMPRGEMKSFLKEILDQAGSRGAEKLKESQAVYMKDFWEKADIRIEGDDRLQQGIRFNLFHIMQAAGRDGRTGMGAKGLTLSLIHI